MTETNDKTLKELLKELLINSYIQKKFFNSDTPEYSEYLRKGSEEEKFLIDAADMGVSFVYADSQGGEGQGDEYWSVYKFTKNSESVFVKFDGSYSSYDGSYYEDWYFVESKMVEVCRFFRIKE